MSRMWVLVTKIVKSPPPNFTSAVPKGFLVSFTVMDDLYPHAIEERHVAAHDEMDLFFKTKEFMRFWYGTERVKWFNKEEVQ